MGQVQTGDLLVDPAGFPDDGRPLGLVELAALPEDFAVEALPAYPVMGLGDPRHPLAGSLDAVIEPPVSVETLVANVVANPVPAAVLVNLLRGDCCESIAIGLQSESLAYGILQGSQSFRDWLVQNAMPSGPIPIGDGDVRTLRNKALLQIVLNRPGARNAINSTLRDGLFEAFSIAVLDPEIERVELRAVGPAFSIGGDLAEFGTTRDPAQAHLIRSRTLPAIPLSRCAAIVDVHIQGACIGAGIEMAAFAGRVTASPNAWFQLPELAMGLIPGAGGTVSIPRRIGRQRAGLMMLSGRRIGARTALDWGLIDAIEDRPAVDPDALDLDLG